MAYTDQQTLDKKFAGRMLTVQANSGELVIEALHEAPDTWVTVQTINEDFAGEIIGLGRVTLRFTPSGGATYAVW